MALFKVQEIRTYKITAEDEDEAILAISDDNADDYLLDVDITVNAY